MESHSFILHNQEIISPESIEFLAALKKSSSVVASAEADVDQGWAWAKNHSSLISRMATVGQAVVESDVLLIQQACKLVVKELALRELHELMQKHQHEYLASSFKV